MTRATRQYLLCGEIVVATLMKLIDDFQRTGVMDVGMHVNTLSLFRHPDKWSQACLAGLHIEEHDHTHTVAIIGDEHLPKDDDPCQQAILYIFLTVLAKIMCFSQRLRLLQPILHGLPRKNCPGSICTTVNSGVSLTVSGLARIYPRRGSLSRQS